MIIFEIIGVFFGALVGNFVGHYLYQKYKDYQLEKNTKYYLKIMERNTIRTLDELTKIYQKKN